MGLSENTFYRLSGICGIVAIVLDLPMLYIFGFSAADACIFVTGGLAIAALFTEIKGLLIGAMVMAIISAILCAVIAATYIFVSSVCLALDGLSQGVCNLIHDSRENQEGCDRAAESHTCGEATCCFGCMDTASCGASGCEWTPAFQRRSCQCTCVEPDERACAGADPDCKCDMAYSESSCQAAAAAGGLGANKVGSASWDCFTYGEKAKCSEQGTGRANTEADASCVACTGAVFNGQYGDSGPKCNSAGLTNCKALDDESASAATWTNKGCKAPDASALIDDTEQSDDDIKFRKFCDNYGLACFAVFANMIVCIIIAIGGCCVVCCGKGPDADGGDDDDGKSDE